MADPRSFQNKRNLEIDTVNGNPAILDFHLLTFDPSSTHVLQGLLGLTDARFDGTFKTLGRFAADPAVQLNQYPQHGQWRGR